MVTEAQQQNERVIEFAHELSATLQRSSRSVFSFPYSFTWNFPFNFIVFIRISIESMAEEISTLSISVQSLRKQMKSAPGDIKKQFDPFLEVNWVTDEILSVYMLDYFIQTPLKRFIMIYY